MPGGSCLSKRKIMPEKIGVKRTLEDDQEFRQ